MSRDVADIHGERADFVSGKELVSYFKGLFLTKEGLFRLFGRTLSDSQKVLPKNSSKLSSEKTN